MRIGRTRAGLTALTTITAGAFAFTAGILPAGAADTKKTVTINAPAISIANVAANDNMITTFQGLTGQVVNVATSAGSFAANCDANLSVFKPDGVTVLSGPVCGGVAGALNNITIPANGVYQIKIDPTGTLIGTVKVAVTSVSATKAITPGAPYVTVSVPANGTVDLGFNTGTPKFVAWRATGGTYATVCNLEISVVRPDNTTLVSPLCAGTGTPFVDATSVTSSGVHKLRLHSLVASAGTVKVQLWSAANLAGTITPGAAPITVKLGTPAQNGDYTFAATSGQQVTANVTASTLSSGYLEWIRPNGTQLTYSSFGTGATFHGPFTLDATGTWKVRVDPAGANTGQISLDIDFVTGGGGTIAFGQSKTATINAAGGTQSYTITLTAGQHVSATITSSTIASGYLYFYRPNNTYQTYTSFSTSPSFMDPFVVDTTGTWTVTVDPNTNNTGALTFHIDNVTDVNGTVALATPKTATITQAGQSANYTISLTAGQHISLTVSSSTIASGYVYFYRPNHTYQTYSSFGAGPGFMDPFIIDTSGTWTVTVDPYGTDLGSLTFRVDSVTDVNGTVALATPKTATITQGGQNANYTINLTTGQHVTLTVTSSTINSGYVYLYRPNGTYLAYLGFGTSSAFLDPVTIDVTGTWKVTVDPYSNDTGALTFRIDTVTDQTGPITPGGAAVNVNLNQAGKNAVLSFAGTSGQSRLMHMTGSTIAGGGYLYLYRPNGTYLGYCGFSTGTASCSPMTLDATGTWTFVVDPSGTATGTASVSLT